MTDEEQNKKEDDRGRQSAFDVFSEHIEGLMQSVSNLKWDDFRYHFEGMKSIAESADPSAKPYIDALFPPISQAALGMQEWLVAKTPEDQGNALVHLNGARDALRRLKADWRELTNNPGFVQMALGIETQVLQIQLQVAKARGDANQVALLEQQQGQLLEDMIAAYGPDEPMRHILEAVKLLGEAQPKFINGLQAALEMNLDLAHQYLQESTRSFDAMRDHFTKGRTDMLIVQVSRQVAEGFSRIASGQDAYVRTLRAAIVGDVSKGDVSALQQAERDFVDGAELIAKASRVLPSVFGGVEVIKPMGERASQLTRNLRTLCERSLTPKEIVISAAPKFVMYFLGIFLVFLFALRIGGGGAEFSLDNVGLLLLFSLLASLIGTFGLAATRFVPLLNALGRLLGQLLGAGGSQPSDSTQATDQEGSE